MTAVLKLLTSSRPMTLEDLDGVMTIEVVNFPYPWSRGNFSDSLSSGYSCWVVLHEKRIIGYAILMMVLDEAHLLNISIDKSFQSMGLGRDLLMHVMQIGRGYGGLNMFLEVRPSNFSAISLYESIGFNEMALRRNYYPAKQGREDAVLMGIAL